jgi:hypothetical protein
VAHDTADYHGGDVDSGGDFGAEGDYSAEGISNCYDLHDCITSAEWMGILTLALT